MRLWKKVLVWSLAMLTAFPVLATAAKRLPHISVEAPVAARVNSEFSVTVSCRAMRVCSYVGGIRFDTDQLEVVDITSGDAPVLQDAVCGISTAVEANAVGAVSCYAAHSREDAYDAGTLLIVTFRGKETGVTDLESFEDCDGREAFCSLSGTAEILLQDTEDAVTQLTWRMTTIHGDLTLRQGSTPVWQRSNAGVGDYAVSVSPGEYILDVARDGDYTRCYEIHATSDTDLGEIGSIPWGDVNGSGDLDVTDLECLYAYLSERRNEGALPQIYFKTVADCNRDGQINILDYQYLYDVWTSGEIVLAEEQPVWAAVPTTESDSPTQTDPVLPTDPATPTEAGSQTDISAATDVISPADLSTPTDPVATPAELAG